MGGRARIEPIGSRMFKVKIERETHVDPVTGFKQQTSFGWHVVNTETCAHTESSTNMDDYKKLKRVWRRSKEDFNSACRFMQFHDLFSVAGATI